MKGTYSMMQYINTALFSLSDSESIRREIELEHTAVNIIHACMQTNLYTSSEDLFERAKYQLVAYNYSLSLLENNLHIGSMSN